MKDLAANRLPFEPDRKRCCECSGLLGFRAFSIVIAGRYLTTCGSHYCIAAAMRTAGGGVPS